MRVCLGNYNRCNDLEVRGRLASARAQRPHSWPGLARLSLDLLGCGLALRTRITSFLQLLEFLMESRTFLFKSHLKLKRILISYRSSVSGKCQWRLCQGRMEANAVVLMFLLVFGHVAAGTSQKT